MSSFTPVASASNVDCEGCGNGFAEPIGWDGFSEELASGENFRWSIAVSGKMTTLEDACSRTYLEYYLRPEIKPRTM